MTHDEYVRRRDEIFRENGIAKMSLNGDVHEVCFDDKGIEQAQQAIDQLVLDVIGADEKRRGLESIEYYSALGEVGKMTRNKTRQAQRKIVIGDYEIVRGDDNN